MKKAVSTNKAPQAIGPYSQGVSFGDLIFTSGQIPVNPASSEIPSGIKEQTKQVLSNISAVLEAAGSSMDKVLKTTVYIKDMNDFASDNFKNLQSTSSLWASKRQFAVSENSLYCSPSSRSFS